MRRRDFTKVLIGSAIAWPITARAQQPGELPIIGFLGANTPAVQSCWTAAFVQGLHELGWTEGHNVRIEYRWGEGRSDRSPAFFSEFIRLKASVIVTHGTANVLAAKQATSLIPIVFTAVSDPVGDKLVESLARPGGNVTGLSNQAPDLAGKRLELRREVIPGLRRIGILANVGRPPPLAEIDDVKTAAQALGLAVEIPAIRGAEDIVSAIEMSKGRVDAIYVQSDPLFNFNRLRINNLALSARLPTVVGFRAFADAGGFLSYGPDFPDLFRHAATAKSLSNSRPNSNSSSI